MINFFNCLCRKIPLIYLNWFCIARSLCIHCLTPTPTPLTHFFSFTWNIYMYIFLKRSIVDCNLMKVHKELISENRFVWKTIWYFNVTKIWSCISFECHIIPMIMFLLQNATCLHTKLLKKLFSHSVLYTFNEVILVRDRSVFPGADDVRLR